MNPEAYVEQDMRLVWSGLTQHLIELFFQALPIILVGCLALGIAIIASSNSKDYSNFNH